MDLQQLKEAMSKAEVETSDVVGPERRGFLNAAFLAGRAVAFPMCVIYRFDEAGKLLSERGYADSGALLPQPVLPL